MRVIGIEIWVREVGHDDGEHSARLYHARQFADEARQVVDVLDKVIAGDRVDARAGKQGKHLEDIADKVDAGQIARVDADCRAVTRRAPAAKFLPDAGRLRVASESQVVGSVLGGEVGPVT